MRGVVANDAVIASQAATVRNTALMGCYRLPENQRKG
jgi:hypothetical protein